MAILDTPTVKSLSDNFENAVVINNKEVVFSDGIILGYWKSMFSNPNIEPIIAIKKVSDSRYDVGRFRLGCIPPLGLIFKNDPAELACDNSTGWYFIQTLHADLPDGRYQDVATTSGLLSQCDKMRAFNQAEIVSTPALTYFDSELTKNSQYCDNIIA